MIEAAKERILATTLPPNSKISQDPKKSTESHPQQSPLSFPSVSNSSAHPIAIATPSVLVTHSPLPADFGLLAPIQPSYNQVDIFPFPASIVHGTPRTYKQLYIATLHIIL